MCYWEGQRPPYTQVALLVFLCRVMLFSFQVHTEVGSSSPHSPLGRMSMASEPVSCHHGALWAHYNLCLPSAMAHTSHVASKHSASRWMWEGFLKSPFSTWSLFKDDKTFFFLATNKGLLVMFFLLYLGSCICQVLLRYHVVGWKPFIRFHNP